MNLERELAKYGGIVIVYDADCPLCNAYVKMTRLNKAVGRPSLVNARERPELVKTFAESGVNLDEGMVVYYEGRLYVGSEAINLLALLTTPIDFDNQVAATILARPSLAKMLYPFVVEARGKATVHALRNHDRHYASPGWHRPRGS